MFFMDIETPKDRDKIRKIYADYRDYAYITAIKILGDRACAEDAVQIVFENLIKNFQKYKNLSCHKMTNLIVIMSRNTAINIYKKRRLENEAERKSSSNDTGIVSDTLDTVISRETYNETVAAIKNLPAIYRDVFLMKHVYGHDNREIAEMFGISEDNVRQRLSRARQKVAEILKRGESNAEK